MNVYVSEIIPGETFFREIHVKNEDGTYLNISTATKRVTASEAISASDFTLAAGDENYALKIRSDATRTSAWPEGQHKIRVWLDWPSDPDIENEVIWEERIVVKEIL